MARILDITLVRIHQCSPTFYVVCFESKSSFNTKKLQKKLQKACALVSMRHEGLSFLLKDVDAGIVAVKYSHNEAKDDFDINDCLNSLALYIAGLLAP